MPFVFTLLSVLFAFPVQAELISMTVGRTEKRLFTSREVHIQHLLEVALQSDDRKYSKLSEDSKAFFDQVDQTLLEWMIAREATHFSTVRLSKEEFEERLQGLPHDLFQSAAWKSLGVTDLEWRQVFRRKIQANKFIDFRAQSSVIPVSDVEAQRYFDENRLKFGNLPFDQFKENIKIFLRRSQVESRLKDWYDVLHSKYKARNFLSEI